MSLGLLAKDSIANLKDFGRDAESRSAQSSSSSLDTRPSLDDGKQATDKGIHSVIDSIVSTEPQGESSEQAAAANPQQALEEEDGQQQQESEASPSSYGNYSGFQSDYPPYQQGYNDAQHDTYYHHDTYSPDYLGEKSQKNSLFYCLFPWLKAQPQRIGSEAPFAEPAQSYAEIVDDSQRPKSPRDDDETSNSSDVLGEKLSDKERQAVLARLGLAQPEASAAAQTDAEPSIPGVTQNGLLNGLRRYDSSDSMGSGITPLKGILKRGSTISVPVLQAPKSSGSASSNDAPKKRRSLFPSYESSGGKSRPTIKPVAFAPMARVVTIKSKNDMPDEEKGDVWWQRMDYDDFRKTGRIITKAMVQGGSEIWLQHSTSSSDNDTAKTDSDPADMITATGDKWWHKFGHSRRGLEHVVSMDEGRQRQLNVRHASRSVIDEQGRQKMYNRQDPDKLRAVSLTNTSWARDLALAAGSSDADAVKSNFDSDRKSREFYLIKMARTSPTLNNSRHVPEFMQPAKHTARATLPQARMLDAHTSTQIRYRRQQNIDTAAADLDSSSKKSDDSQESSEPIRDPDPEEKKSGTMAQLAAGFSVSGEKVDMAAVLSGMGPVPQEPAAVPAN
jgi:hypothetical protein